MTDATPRSALPLLAAAQSQKHVTHNEALLEMDALLCCTVLDRDLSDPPPAPADGDTYLVKPSGTGAWAGQDGKIAYAIDGGWRFYAPFKGIVAYIADETKLVVYDGAAFVDYASVLSLQNVPLLGVNAAADSTNKLAVKSAAVLFDNTGAGVQAKLNKNASADTASFLFQTGFAGRAEMGTTGDDNFHFKVSPDGATFYESLILNRSTGSVLLKHVDVSAATTLGAAHLGRMVRTDASAGAFALTLPASADADDWVIVRKKDASASRVTVKDSGGADLAWLSAQLDEAMFAFWDGAWAPVRWSIAPLTQVFTANGTWTKPPLARAVNAVAIGAGGGGGSGRRGRDRAIRRRRRRRGRHRHYAAAHSGGECRRNRIGYRGRGRQRRSRHRNRFHGWQCGIERRQFELRFARPGRGRQRRQWRHRHLRHRRPGTGRFQCDWSRNGRWQFFGHWNGRHWR